MAMILQRERKFFRPGLVRRAHMVPSGAGEFDVVLHEHAVVKNSFARGARQFSRRIKTRAMKNDVVSLPLARRTRSVHQRRILAIDRRGLPVGIRLALIGVEDCRLVESVEEDAAVAPVLVVAFRGSRLGTFHVDLAIAKSSARMDLSGLWRNRGITD